MKGTRITALIAAAWLALTPLVATGDTAWAADKPDKPEKKIQPHRTDDKPKAKKDQILVAFRDGTPEDVEREVHRKKGGEVVDEVADLKVKVVKVRKGTAEELIRDYRADPAVEYAEPDGLAYAQAFPADAPPSDWFYPQQWALNDGAAPDADIAAPEAWRATIGSASVAIAILDTGIRADHPDLAGKVQKSQNFTWSATADDRYGHGTHVAASAAANTNNGQEGVAGVCPNCVLYSGKVLGDDGGGAYSWIANGIAWAANNNARVINMSLGGTLPSITLQRAVDNAWNKGAVLTCAAGNNGNSTRFYPAASANCIAVGATDGNNVKASFSNYGSSWVDVAAPGVDILSALPVDNSVNASPSGYAWWGGTSMAAPHVAGIAGLIRSKSPNGSAAAVRRCIEDGAARNAGTGSQWAKGLVNAAAAVTNC